MSLENCFIDWYFTCLRSLATVSEMFKNIYNSLHCREPFHEVAYSLATHDIYSLQPISSTSHRGLKDKSAKYYSMKFEISIFCRQVL